MHTTKTRPNVQRPARKGASALPCAIKTLHIKPPLCYSKLLYGNFALTAITKQPPENCFPVTVESREGFESFGK